MTNDIVKSASNFLIQPSTFAEFERYCTMIAKSSFCPKQFMGKPGDVMVAVQMGAELGLSPMQAIQNIAVINGRPSVWGDAALAVVMGSHHYEWHKEWITGEVKSNDRTAHCTIKRKGSPEYTVSFSQAEAIKASLWGKPGVWQQYPDRMLQMRARGFAIRDKFADALRGINIREEVEDYKIKDVTPTSNEEMHKEAEEYNKNVISGEVSKSEQVKNEPSKMQLSPEELSKQVDQLILEIDYAQTTGDLKKIIEMANKLSFKNNQELFKKIIDAKDERKKKLMQTSIETIDSETGEVTNGDKE